MSAKKDNPSAQAPRVEAAEWFIRLQGDEVSAQDQEIYADWLQRSPVHVEEFLRLAALQGDLAGLPEIRDADVNKLLADLSQAQENVLDLEPHLRRPPVAERPPRAFWSRWLVAAAVLAVAAVGALLASGVGGIFRTEYYTTAVGEQRSLTLADGSHIELNVRSRLAATVDATTRDIRLNDGEALFQVAKDPAHPFRVHTPQATIEAKGTQFNVHVAHGRTIVALLEGRVEVRGVRGAPVLLEPGQEITIASQSAGTAAAPRKADLHSVTAWTQRRLIFVDRPLNEVIEEFNRYSRQPFVIDDPAIRDMRISINFKSDSAETFGASLAAASGLKVVQQSDGAWLIERQH